MCEITVKAKTENYSLTYCNTILYEKRGKIVKINANSYIKENLKICKFSDTFNIQRGLI